MKTFIKNRNGNEICVVVENENHTTKLAFAMHGLGGRKEEPQLRAMVEAFIEDDYTVVTWDAVHTFGESSGGLYEDATITNYYADMEDVMAWSRKQKWFVKPFALCGHSLGGISTALYAENHPEQVTALAPIATVVNGTLRLETRSPEVIAAWKRDGTRTQKRRNGDYKTLKWSHMEDGMKYDLTAGADKLTMPVLMVVGEKDTSTPPAHQQILFDVLPDEKEIHVIKDAEHSFYQPRERAELKAIIRNWLKETVR